MAGLIAKAEDAQDLAAAFNKFLGHVPNAATEITGLISELYAISSGARELHTASQDPRYLNRQELIEEDKRLVLQSIEQTFADIQREFGNIDRSIYQTPREAYRGVWKDIIEHFREESEDHLIRRLENYRLFLLELALIVHGGRPTREGDDLRYYIERLRRFQGVRLDARFGNMALDSQTPRQRSFERMRRGPGLPPEPPNENWRRLFADFTQDRDWRRGFGEPASGDRVRRRRAAEPLWGDWNWERWVDDHPADRPYYPRADYPRAEYPRADYPRAEYSRADYPRADYPRADYPRADYPRADYPRADYPRADYPRADYPRADYPRADYPRAEPFRRPSRPDPPPALFVDPDYFPIYDEDIPIPDSPSTTTATSTTTASTPTSNTGSVAHTHWLPLAFEQNRSTTRFPTVGQISACYGPDMPGASRNIGQSYERLLDLPFETGELVVRIYLRSSDNRARIHCRFQRGRRMNMQSSLHVTHLRIARVDSCLQLHEPRTPSQSPKLWATLRFPTYERMILFYCAFLALKIQDEANPVRDLNDHMLAGEDHLFSGVIIDDSFEHILRLYYDRDSKGIRLLASAKIGSLKRMPVWTAFITYQIHSKDWMRRSGRRIVRLSDLTRYVFTTEYEAQRGPQGEDELCFPDPKDADDFLGIIEDLAKRPAAAT